MALPTAVNDQITDAVTQANVKVVAESPAMAMGALYQASSHAMGIAFENATANSKNSETLALAVISQCVAKLTGKPAEGGKSDV